MDSYHPAVTISELDATLRECQAEDRMRKLCAVLVQRYPEDRDVADLAELAMLHADEVAALELEAIGLRDDRAAARFVSRLLAQVQCLQQ